MSKETIDLQALIQELGPQIAEYSRTHDRKGTFVREAYELLQERGVMGALVPTELGGGGASLTEMCDFLRQLAHQCPSTALCLSMHTHLVAATVWKYRKGKGGEPLLRKVAEERIGLVSTGATDWIDSNGTMTRVEGGYRVSGRKVFGSGSPGAAMIITSSRYEDPERGTRVLHFPVPLAAEGVRSLGDWDTLGMRGTGSNTLMLENVFVPDSAIALDRPTSEWHPVWSVVCTVALPIIMSCYLGIAEKAAMEARRAAKGKIGPHSAQLVGQMENALVECEIACRSMVENGNDFDFDPSLERANAALVRKTLCTNAARKTVERALVAAGGRGFFRSSILEQLFRDVQAAHFHPLPEHKQLEFSGRVALGLDPVS